MAALLPFSGLCSMGTSACLAATNVVSICCSLAACFSCKASYGASKVLYIGIFLLSAVLGIVLRYQGEAALSGWATRLGVCTNAECWGQQADYRISGALFAFYLTMAGVSAMYRPAHLGAWFVKLLYFLLLLGLTLLVPNDFWAGYAQFSRYGSVVFIVIQCLLIIDFAYKAHEYLLARVDRADAALEAKGWEPGLCSSPWKAGYILLAGGGMTASLVCLGVMFRFFGECSLNQFFLAETLIAGVALTFVSVFNSVGKGLLPPTLLFSYCTYLVYGAITNNPNTACNVLATQDNQNQASIITGCAISVLSVTWAAYSSAGKAGTALTVDSGATAQANPMAAGGAPAADAEAGESTAAVTEWRGSGRSAGQPKGAEEGAAASYQGGGAGAAPASADGDDDSRATTADRRPWVFHLIMALGGLYLAMAITNWGSSNATTPSANPELSDASMWVRIASQWLLHVLYVWTLLAPTCCPGRDFS